MANAGISGLGVAAVTAGALLMYAGIKNVSPLAALRSISTGVLPGSARAKALAKTENSNSDLWSGGAQESGGGEIAEAEASLATGSGTTVNVAYTVGGGPFPALPAAAQQFAGDQYSQLKRWQPGYSDCSSFVGKSLKALGITPPGASTTLSYLASGQWKKTTADSAGAGDLAVNSAHMVILTGPGTAIGQENPTRNVQTGTVAGLMSGTGPYVYLRYADAGNQNIRAV